MSAKRSVYLYNQENVMGVMFNLTEEELEEKLENGWQDSPAGLELPEDNDTGMTEEEVTNARPEDLIELVKSYGFIVLTPEQMKAEAMKMADVVLDIEKFSDEDLITEAERRGLKESDAGPTDEEGEPLINRFIQSPTALTKEELVTLGAEFRLGLRMSFSEQTMIDKITAAIEEDKTTQGEE